MAAGARGPGGGTPDGHKNPSVYTSVKVFRPQAVENALPYYLTAAKFTNVNGRVYNWKAPVHDCIYNRQCVGVHSLYKWKRPNRPPAERDPQPTDRASQRGTAAGLFPDDGTRWAPGRAVAGARLAGGSGVAICKGSHPERPFPQSMSVKRHDCKLHVVK